MFGNDNNKNDEMELCIIKLNDNDGTVSTAKPLTRPMFSDDKRI
jgi:hypothetical protein